ncbi:hypothetical protein C7C46_16055 [Streptomyces tateyamensis]|uniref:Regulatory protein n=2 Tax=Streptomyces tateyamensis TaxID=565073 RepID=A0A2V4NH66_9ACTN|nr:hypothetical protein C7C46_16055 [Streptomyces tateyamensis]
MGRLGVAMCVSVEAKVDPETGEVKSNAEGVQVWAVTVAVRPEGRKTALVEISVAGEPVGVEPGRVVEVHGLDAFWWEMNGRTGLAYRAEKVTVAVETPPRPPADPRPARAVEK